VASGCSLAVAGLAAVAAIYWRLGGSHVGRTSAGGSQSGLTGGDQIVPIGWSLVHTIRRGLLLFAATIFLFGAVITLTSGLQPGPSASGRSAAAASAPPARDLCFSTEKCVPVTPFNGPVTAPPIVSVGFMAVGLTVLVGLRWRRVGPAGNRLALAVQSAVYRPPIAR
jgi:hypothetical protein